MTSSSGFEVTVRRSSKAKYVRIKVCERKGVQLIVPAFVSEKRALVFLESKKVWVLNQLTRIKIRHKSNDSGKIMIFGEFVEPVSKLEKKKVLLSYLAQSCKKYAGLLGVTYKKITVRDTYNQWGSCSIRGNLSFSSRLIQFPKEVIDYVVCHEVAHLVVRDHSKKFWGVVSSICPNYKLLKKRLKPISSEE